MLAKSTSSYGVPTSKEEGGIHILQQELEPSCRTNLLEILAFLVLF
jgi:hypothetical protein